MKTRENNQVESIGYNEEEYDKDEETYDEDEEEYDEDEEEYDEDEEEYDEDEEEYDEDEEAYDEDDADIWDDDAWDIEGIKLGINEKEGEEQEVNDIDLGQEYDEDEGDNKEESDNIEDEVEDIIDSEQYEEDIIEESDNIETDINDLEQNDETDGSLDEENIDSDTEIKERIITTNEVINSNGEIVVQDSIDDGERFKLKYVDIRKILIVHRVRKVKSVDTLVESIKSTGLLTPLVIAPTDVTDTEGIYVLIDGYRRIIACAKTGISKIPCIINTKILAKDIPVLEALYNHNKQYSTREIVDYIDYLEKEKGIFNASMIEYLLQMDSGDYTKLKDILEDDDDTIVTPLLNGEINIGQAFKKLEGRRKKESKEEKEVKQVEKVYDEQNEAGKSVREISNSGESADNDEVLSEQEIASLIIDNAELDEVADGDNSLDKMVEESKQMEGFEPNQQDYRDRQRLDPALRKAVLARDDNTCQTCGLSGQEYLNVFDVHHKVEVYLGGSDDIDNLITVCVCCHRIIHEYARGDLYIRPESELSEEEAKKFKKIIALGNIIRKGLALKGMKKKELKRVDQAELIGRTRPGGPIQVAG